MENVLRGELCFKGERGASAYETIGTVVAFSNDIDPNTEFGGVWTCIGTQTIGDVVVTYWNKVANV